MLERLTYEVLHINLEVNSNLALVQLALNHDIRLINPSLVQFAVEKNFEVDFATVT
jgi:hypothetical protein